MGELVFIGLGLDGEKGITLRGLAAARSRDDNPVPCSGIRANEPPRSDPREPDRGAPHARPPGSPGGWDVLSAAGCDRLAPADGLCPEDDGVRSAHPRMRPEPSRFTRGAC